MTDLEAAIAQIKEWDKMATSGPWIQRAFAVYDLNEKELLAHTGGTLGAGPRTREQEANAGLIAVQRTWTMRIIEDRERLLKLLDGLRMENDQLRLEHKLLWKKKGELVEENKRLNVILDTLGNIKPPEDQQCS